MKRTSYCLAVTGAGCVLLSGCLPTYYEVELVPDGGTMHRSIERPFGPEHYDHVASIYGIEPTAEILASFDKKDDSKHSFSGSFEFAMPDDNNNSGYLYHCDSPLGSASWYTERFGGHDQIATTLENQKTAVNRMWDLWLVVLEALVGAEPEFDELRSFLDLTMRNDILNMAQTMSVTDIGVDATVSLPDLGGEFEGLDTVLRLLHYLDAHGYIEPAEILSMITESENAFDDEAAGFIKILGRSIGRKMGLPGNEQIPPAFARLAAHSYEELEQAIDQLIQESASVSALLTRWKDEDHAQGLTDKQMLEAMAQRALSFELSLFSLGGDVLRVRLRLPIEPYVTNGRWIEEDAALEPAIPGAMVEWMYPLASSLAIKSDLPVILHAMWAEPSVEYQVQKFGAVVLEQEDLDAFCWWRLRLAENQLAAWDAFVDELHGGPDLRASLQRFRFVDEPERTVDENSNTGQSQIAADVIRDILNGLARAQKEP